MEIQRKLAIPEKTAAAAREEALRAITAWQNLIIPKKLLKAQLANVKSMLRQREAELMEEKILRRAAAVQRFIGANTLRRVAAAVRQASPEQLLEPPAGKPTETTG